MLVLARKANQIIRIGDQITISVVSVRGRTVRLGIEAPGDVRIVRGELTMALEQNPSSENDCRTPESDDPAEVPSAGIPAEAFAARPRLNTAYVNRVLSLRQKLKDHPAPATVSLAFS